MIHGDKANIAVSLSSTVAPKGWGRWIGEKKEGALVTMGRRRSPRAFFHPLPRGLCRGESSCLLTLHVSTELSVLR